MTLLAGFPVPSISTTVNTYRLTKNCYYCTIAALHNMTTDELVRQSEIMQQDIAQVHEIVKLMECATEVKVKYQEVVCSTHEEATHNVRNLIIDSTSAGQAAFGLAYYRGDGSGHMVVLVRNGDTLYCADYQRDACYPFPPENHIRHYFVFGRDAVDELTLLTSQMEHLKIGSP